MTRAPLRTREQIATAALLIEVTECLTELMRQLYGYQTPNMQRAMDRIEWRLADAKQNYRDTVRAPE